MQRERRRKGEEKRNLRRGECKVPLDLPLFSIHSRVVSLSPDKTIEGMNTEVGEPCRRPMQITISRVFRVAQPRAGEFYTVHARGHWKRRSPLPWRPEWCAGNANVDFIFLICTKRSSTTCIDSHYLINDTNVTSKLSHVTCILADLKGSKATSTLILCRPTFCVIR